MQLRTICTKSSLVNGSVQYGVVKQKFVSDQFDQLTQRVMIEIHQYIPDAQKVLCTGNNFLNSGLCNNDSQVPRVVP